MCTTYTEQMECCPELFALSLQYHCTAVIENGTRPGSNVYLPIVECE